MEVPVSSNTRVTKVTIDDNTQVKKVVVGRPVRRVREAISGSLSGLSDIDETTLEDPPAGAVLSYNAETGKFEAVQINGGSY